MAKALKIVLVGINILLLIFGALMVSLGIWAYLTDVEIINLANIDSDGKYSTSFRSPGFLEIMAWISLSAGVVTFFLAILALYGAAKEAKWMLSLYASLLFLVMVLGFATIGLGVAMRDRLNNDLRNALWDGIRNQYEGILKSQFTFSMAFDQAQVQFDCCGLDNYTDFTLSATRWTDRGALVIPKACCKVDEYQYSYERLIVFEVGPECPSRPNATNSNINKQCYDDIEDSLMTKTLVLMAISIVAAIFQILGILFGCCLLRTFKDNDTVDTKTYGY